MLNQSAPVIYSVTNLLWSDTFTGVKWIVTVIWDRAITLSQKKWFVLFWMCDFIALTWCCKLMSFLHFIFAVLLPNRMPNTLRVTWLRHAPFPENFYHARSAFKRRCYVPNLKSLSQAVSKLYLIVGAYAKNLRATWPTRPLGKVIYVSSRHSTCEAIDQIWSL